MKRLLLAALAVWTMMWALLSCQTRQAGDAPRPKRRLSITINNCMGVGNFMNMFDEYQYTSFAPNEMEVYSLAFSNPVGKMAFVPTRRRGFSGQYRILAISGAQLVEASPDSPVIDFGHPVDSVRVLFINTADTMRSMRFYRDRQPFSISIDNPRSVLSFSEMRMVLQDGRRPDTVAIVVGTEKDPSLSAPQKISQLYRNQVWGPLLGRKMALGYDEEGVIWKIFANGEFVVVDSSGHVDSGVLGRDATADISGNAIRIGARVLPFDGRDDDFVNLRCFPELFMFDIRYATTNNFTNTQLYSEPICYLRYVAARDLIAAARDFQKRGYVIKMFDGYRPYPVQAQMWKVCPNPNFLSPPTKGSIHNRGGAVDLTIAYPNGENLDMGTDYDFCGPAAYTTNTNLPDSVLEHRRVLQEVLGSHHFNMIRTEWWHFSHSGARNFELCSFWPAL